MKAGEIQNGDRGEQGERREQISRILKTDHNRTCGSRRPDADPRVGRDPPGTRRAVTELDVAIPTGLISTEIRPPPVGGSAITYPSPPHAAQRDIVLGLFSIAQELFYGGDKRDRV